jgi:hypothetical protein
MQQFSLVGRDVVRRQIRSGVRAKRIFQTSVEGTSRSTMYSSTRVHSACTLLLLTKVIRRG